MHKCFVILLFFSTFADTEQKKQGYENRNYSSHGQGAAAVAAALCRQ
jgi:hypothetical protein